MKKIIRLTESDLIRIVKRVINEQLAPMVGEIIGDIADFGINMPSVDTKMMDQACKTKKTEGELVLGLFYNLRKLATASNVNNPDIQRKVNELEKSINGGLTMNDGGFKNIINQIKTPEEMGTVLVAYNNKFKKPLFQTLSDVNTTTWSTIWEMVKKFATPKVKLDYCKVRNTVSA